MLGISLMAPIVQVLCIDLWMTRLISAPVSAWRLVLVSEAVYLVCRMKRGIIWLVHLYQHYAPDELRRQCLFTPSCSEYMILAVEKYGVVLGVFKGAKRLFRCRGLNGGIDNP